MFFDRTHSIMAVLATLAFTAMLTLPCFCATASAQMESETEERCPCSEEEHGNEHEDCCCGCSSASPVEEGTDLRPAGGAVLSSLDEDELQKPASWWSPDLVAALWLIDRLVDFETAPPSIEAYPPLLRPDRSDTYLQNSTFLI